MKLNSKFVLAANDGGSLARPATRTPAERREAFRQFETVVNERVKKRGWNRDDAWREAKKTHPHLWEAANEKVEGVELSPDGSILISAWPVSRESLMALGLHASATRQEYAIAKLALQCDDLPEHDAYVLTMLIRHGQIKHGQDFHAAWEDVKEKNAEFWPDLQAVSVEFPLSERTLLGRNLPVDATRDQVALFELAKGAKLAPELAALTLRTIQRNEKQGFDSAAAFLRKHYSPVWEKISKVR